MQPIDYIERTRSQYESLGYPPYSWVHNDDEPAFQPLKKPLSQSRLGLVASGGIYSEGQVAFHFKDDLSFRIINTRQPSSQLRATHFAYDLTDARRDINVVFPVDTLAQLAMHNRIGELSTNAYTFMGGIYSSRKVRDILAPAIAERLIKDEVDVALLVPVWPVCHQSVGLIARELEAQGIPTLCMSSALSITTAVNPPRAVYLDFPLGHTAGKANDQSINRRIMIDTLSAFESIQVPGKIKTLKYRWAQDDAWKDSVMRPGKRKHAHADNRVERVSEPQYQSTDDELAAMQAMEQDGCPTCIWLTSD